MNTRHLVALLLATTLGWAVGSAQANDTIQWAPDVTAAREIAQAQNRPVLVHFWAPSCVPCLRLEKEVFSRPEVGQAVNGHYIPVKVNTDQETKLAEQYGVRSIPCDVVITPNGQLLYKMASPSNADTYVQKLVAAAQSPTTMIAQRLSQQATATAAGATANPGSELANQATQLAQQANPPWSQQLSETQQAADQQAQAWQQGLQARAQQFVNQSGQTVNRELQRGVDKVTTAAQPTGEAISQAAAQVSQAATTFQTSIQPVQQQALAATTNANGQLEQFNPFVAGPVSQPPAPSAPAAAAGPPATPQTSAVAATVPTGPAAQPSAMPTAGAVGPTTPPAASSATLVPAANVTATGTAPAAQVPPAPPAQAFAAPAFPAQSAQSAQSASVQQAPTAPANPFAQATSPPTAPAEMPAAPSGVASGPATAPMGERTANNTRTAANRPAGNQPPRVGLDGFCPVTLMTESRWQPGNKRWGAVHRGRTYLFASSKNQLEFLANPDRFAPVLAGIDPVVLTTKGQIVEGKRAHGVVYKDEVHGDQIYLFSSEESLKEFWVKPTAYAGTVRQAMQDGTVGRFLR